MNQPLRKGPSGPPASDGAFTGDGTVRTTEDGQLEAIEGDTPGQLWYYDGVTWQPSLTGPEDGQTPIWDNGTDSWRFANPGSGGSVAPLTYTFYVDAGTDVDPSDQDGSIGAPYSTLQAAIDAAALVPTVNFVQRALILVAPSPSPLSPGAGDGFFDTGYNVQLTIKGLGSTPSLNTQTNVARIGAITTSDPVTQAPVFTFDSVYIDSITVAQRASESQIGLCLYNCYVEQNTVCFSMVLAKDTTFGGTVSPGIIATNCTFGFGEAPGPSADQRNYGAIIASGTIPSVTNTRIDSITQSALNRTGYDFSPGIPYLESSTVQGSVNLPNEGDNTGPENIFAADPLGGLYEIDAYLCVTNASGSGTVQIDVTYNDGTDVRTISSDGVDVAAGGFDTLKAIIQVAQGTNVTYATSGVDTPGALAYSLRVTARVVQYDT